MSEAMLEQGKGLRFASRLGEVVDDGLAAAREMGKHVSDAAEELIDDTAARIKRHPAETVLGAFTVGAIVGATGVVVGGILGWIISRRK